jgi:hypothetical protein
LEFAIPKTYYNNNNSSNVEYHVQQLFIKHFGSMLLCTISDVQLHGYAFGEWRCVFIIYVVLDMQSHFWDNVDKLF